MKIWERIRFYEQKIQERNEYRTVQSEYCLNKLLRFTLLVNHYYNK